MKTPDCSNARSGKNIFTKCIFRLLDIFRTLYYNITLLHYILSYYKNHLSTYANNVIPVILDVVESAFDVHVTVSRVKFLIIKPIRCTNFSNLFWNETIRVSASTSVHHQEFFTVHTAMVYVIQVCCVHSEKLMMDRATVRNM
jgi:hypothetical protein